MFLDALVQYRNDVRQFSSRLPLRPDPPPAQRLLHRLQRAADTPMAALRPAAVSSSSTPTCSRSDQPAAAADCYDRGAHVVFRAARGPSASRRPAARHRPARRAALAHPRVRAADAGGCATSSAASARCTSSGPCVTVFGSARFGEDHPHYELAREIGRRVARLGFTVMTGGGPGMMEAANRGARDVGGRSVGCNIELPFEQDANPYLDRWSRAATSSCARCCCSSTRTRSSRCPAASARSTSCSKR